MFGFTTKRFMQARIHSLDGEMDTVQLLETDGNGHYIVDYKGTVCKAIFNWFDGTLYADDLYAILPA
jgi:hypothetical protein